MMKRRNAPMKSSSAEERGNKAAEFNEPGTTENAATAHDVVYEWASSASIHGLHSIFDIHALLWKRLLFFVLFCVCLGFLIWNLVAIAKDYTRYDTTTTSRSVAPGYLVFPDVTVCNACTFQESRMEGYRSNRTNPKTDQEINDVSQTLYEFMLYTQFNQKLLEPLEDYWTPVLTDLGLCWTFHTEERVTVPNPAAGGLSFAAFIDRENCFYPTDGEGIIVYVTEPNATSITAEQPFTFLSPGFINMISFDVTEIQREEREPWSSCVKLPRTYSQAGCRAECAYNYTLNDCGCRSLGDYRPEALDVGYCNLISWDQPDCIARQRILGQIECNCPDPPCRENQYRTRLSFWQFSQILMEILGFIAENEEWEGDVEKNVVGAYINFDAIRREEVTETRSWSPTGLLAAIGGLLGFFLGMSLFSFAEGFDFLCLRMLPRCWGDRRLYGVGSKLKDEEETSAGSDAPEVEKENELRTLHHEEDDTEAAVMEA